MKKSLFWMFLMASVLTISLVSCAGAEDGESWDTWVMRNQLNSNWSLGYVKVNGEYRHMGEEGFDFYLTLNLYAEGRKFKAERFYYKDGRADESTRVEKEGTYTIDEPSKTIELTDSEGNKFIRLSNIQFETGSMSATVLFYDLNKTYEVGLDRSARL
jgi:hypothetical protein